ncbi:MAG: DUF504 domain-containing protein [Syntrophobacteraceae bacterium]
MVPIRELLSRIRWDKAFGEGLFEIGYLDHVERRIIRVPFAQVHLQKSNRFSFMLEDDMNDSVTIPFHRVREVYRDGILIWQRTVSG